MGKTKRTNFTIMSKGSQSTMETFASKHFIAFGRDAIKRLYVHVHTT